VVCELPADKPEGTYRIFVLGGSVAKGMPGSAFSFGRILGAMLRERFPDARFEVINAAMTAINSHVVLPIARDCADHQADLFVVYMGNNEVVGPYGSGAVFGGFSRNLSVIRGSICLKTTRIGQLMTDLIAGRDGTAAQWQGMRMFLDHRVAADDPRMESVYSHFRENLSDICEAIRRPPGKVIVCTVPVNLRDCAPFASVHRAEFSEADRARWRKLHDAGVASFTAGDAAGAVERFRQASQIGDRRADLHFRLGRCFLGLKQFDKAREHLVLARDLDALRFRADRRINRIIREVADEKAEEGVVLADVERAFEESDRTQHGLAGEGLFYEHVHMRPEGTYLLAKVVFQQIVGVLPGAIRKSASTRVIAPRPELCFERIALTGWDRYRMESYFTRGLDSPPFTSQMDHEERADRHGRELERLRAEHASADGLADARRRYAAALGRSPGDLEIRRNFAKLLEQFGDDEGAAQQWRVLVGRRPDVAAWHLEYGKVLSRQRKFPEAVSEFREAMRINEFLAGAGHALIGEARAEQGQEDAAEEHLRRALAINPSLSLAHNSLGRIIGRKGRLVEAKEHFREAIRLDPGLASAHMNLAIVLAREGKFSEVAERCRQVLRVDPGHIKARHNLGVALWKLGKTAEAIDRFGQVLRRRGDYLLTVVALGRIRASHQDAKFRDGLEAIRLILPACRRTGYRDPVLLDALAAAYAEAGRFNQAVAAATKALQLAQDGGKKELASAIRQRLSLYRRGDPYRMPAAEDGR